MILKSAIFEEPFKPQAGGGQRIHSRHWRRANIPTLRGYVCTTPKPRAEIPLVSDKGDPVLAHWQYGLGRAVAFTSDAKPKWATDWMGWEQVSAVLVADGAMEFAASWRTPTSIRTSAIDKGEGHISVEALDAQGNFRNFLNLQTVVVSPKGERQTVRLEQTGPGHYEATIPDEGSRRRI